MSTGGEFEKPEHIDGFSSLLGSIIQSTGAENHAVDFLNPRQAPQPELDKRKLAIGGGIAAALLLLGIGWLWWTISRSRCPNRQTEKGKQKPDHSGRRD